MHTSDPVIVLSERALELIPLANEIDAIAGPDMLRDVHLFAGVARNPDHLIAW
jgi:hypothetical protein